MKTTRSAYLLGLALCFAASSASADHDKAAASYKLGVAAFAHNAFAEAAAAFEAAYAEDPRGASIYNAALAWQSAHEDARAADDFARAVASDLKKDLLDNAKTQLAALEATLGKLSIDGPASARFSVAHASGGLPFEVHVAPGNYVVHATYADGSSGDFAVAAIPAGSTRVDVTPHAVVTLAPLPPPLPETQSGGVLGPKTLPISLALIGGGVVAGGFAIGLGIATLDAISSLKQSGDMSQSAHDSATSLRVWTDVAFIGALVIGGAGIAALVTVHRVKVEAALGPGAFMLHGTF